MNNKNKENNQEKISLINQQYLKELEANNSIFNQKIKNLNNSLLNSEENSNNNMNIKYDNTSPRKKRLNSSQRIDYNYLKYKYNLSQRDLNKIEINPDNNNINNFTFKKKENEKEMRDHNLIEINKVMIIIKRIILII